MKRTGGALLLGGILATLATAAAVYLVHEHGGGEKNPETDDSADKPVDDDG